MSEELKRGIPKAIKTGEVIDSTEEERQRNDEAFEEILMYKVISQLNIGNYAVLELNQSLPKIEYTKYKISGKEYKPIQVYDLPKHIAIEATGNFEGETVEFI